MYQSQDLTDLIDAVELLKSARVSVADGVSFAWNVLNDAGNYLQKQIAAHFAPESLN